MATSQHWKDTSAGTPTTLLSTALNSLAGSALSADYDNSANLDLFADFEFLVEYVISAPTAGTIAANLYLVPSLDGSNYAEGGTSVQSQAANLIASFESRNGSASTFERLIVTGVALPPGHMKFLLINVSGHVLATSGNTLRMRTYQLQSV
jgi:hypothetical protein